VRLISEETVKLTRLVDDLIEVSRFDAGAVSLHLDDIDPRRVRAAHPRPPRLAGLRGDPAAAGRLAPGRFDPHRLDVVVANLVGNAFRHGVPPVRLRMHTEDRPGAGLYDPAVGPANHRRAVARWNWVLDRMVAIGRLSAKERARYTVFPEPRPPANPPGLGGQTGYPVDTARAYVSAHSRISDAQFDLGGHQIYTTCEKPKVDALATAVTERMSTLRPATRPADRNVRVGAASVATDGRILALYGGPDYIKQGFNDANISVVPVGETYTPFVYAAALRDGVVRERNVPRTPVGPESLYDGDDNVPLRTPEGPYWSRNGKIVKTANDGDRSWGEISLRRAVAAAVNGPITQLGTDVGLNQVRQASVDAGLLPDSGFGKQIFEFSLGTATPSPIRMASAYGTFAAAGTHTAPFSVFRVTRDGESLAVEQPTAARSPRRSPQRWTARSGTPSPSATAPRSGPGRRGTPRGRNPGAEACPGPRRTTPRAGSSATRRRSPRPCRSSGSTPRRRSCSL
jgi:hypothetical protein